ncbi:hypothetical protein IFM89_026322 [Coptis chinensis]|uniref:Uncharacterized protein n=1 Tax=Coptis chinensis TaxID=261450 RepID=A0A835I5G5_9MAGN|nr:hypothetical protein IFM89_026322 [Coptis chinensis]
MVNRVQEENSEKGLGIGNFVDVAYGMHEELVGDLSGGDGSQAEDVEPPIVLEPDLGKRNKWRLLIKEEKSKAWVVRRCNGSRPIMMSCQKSLGPTKGVELRGISSNKSKKQLRLRDTVEENQLYGQIPRGTSIDSEFVFFYSPTILLLRHFEVFRESFFSWGSSIKLVLPEVASVIGELTRRF